MNKVAAKKFEELMNRFWLFFRCVFLASCGEKPVSEYISHTNGGQQCRVYLFKSWGTYRHPVKPLNPISYEKALQRRGYYRAWMCGSGEAERFVLFEGIELRQSPIVLSSEIPAGLFFDVVDENGRLGPGAPMKIEDSIDRDRFIITRVGQGEASGFIITQRVSQKFEYEYTDSGALSRVVATNDDGDVNVLDY